jgi:hypothetical protein
MAERIRKAMLLDWAVCGRVLGGRGKISPASEHRTLVQVVRALKENPDGCLLPKAGMYLKRGILFLVRSLYLAGLITPADLELCGAMMTWERLAAYLEIKATPGPSGFAPPRPVTRGSDFDFSATCPQPETRVGYAPPRPVTKKEFDFDA